MRQWMKLLFMLLFPLAPIVALGNDTVGSRSTVRVPTPVTPLHVTFTQKRLSLRVQNASLKSLLEGVAQQTGLSISVSPAVATIPVTVNLSRVEVELALQEILRRAGIANAAWAYRKSPHPSGKADEWELARLTIVAEGHGSSLAPTATSLSNKPESTARKRTGHQKQLSREQLRDPKTNQTIDVAAHEVMVRFDPKMSPDEVQQKIERLHAEVISAIPQFGLYHLSISESDTVSSFIDKHRSDPRLRILEPNPIVSVEPVGTTPNDPFFRAQWSLGRINAPQAWERLPNGAGGIVAVVDSGVDELHPELQSHILSGRNMIEQNDDTQDQHGHGTAIAGIIAATTNNAIGMSGICPTCQILPVKVLDESGEGTYAQVIAGILWAADKKAQIINLSLGSYGFSRLLADAVEYAHQSGAVLVAAGGNEATQAPLYPGALPNVISVSATDPDDNLWVGSNYGEVIDIAAPGVRILSLDTHNNYLFATGSSFSAAHVSGVAALVRTKHPSLKNTHVAQVLFQTADDLGGKGKDQFYGFGRINAARALRAEVR